MYLVNVLFAFISLNVVGVFARRNNKIKHNNNNNNANKNGKFIAIHIKCALCIHTVAISEFDRPEPNLLVSTIYWQSRITPDNCDAQNKRYTISDKAYFFPLI